MNQSPMAMIGAHNPVIRLVQHKHFLLLKKGLPGMFMVVRFFCFRPTAVVIENGERQWYLIGLNYVLMINGETCASQANVAQW